MRAIILAAGKGTRMGKVTNITPKPLVKVDKKPIIERQIECLKEKGINEIIIIIGYLKEKFYYLKDKYGVKFIENDKFNEFNNIYSIYLARKYLEETYVIEGDVFINNNFLDGKINDSTYFTIKKNNFLNEWVVISDEYKNLMGIEIRDGKVENILSGISYLNKIDGRFISQKIENEINDNKYFNNLYWDNIVVKNLKNLNFKVRYLKEYDSFEIDTVKELEELEEYLNKEEMASNNKCYLENIIYKLLKGKNYNIEIKEQVGGLTNNNYKVIINNKSYILRTIRKSSQKMIDRISEKKNNQIAYELGIDKSYFIFREDGFKLSNFLAYGNTLTKLTAKDEKKLKLLCKELRKLHNSNKKFENEFNPLEIIIKYEKILKQSDYKFDNDYVEMRENIINIINKLNEIGVESVPCHNDLLPENCILHDGRISIIDWEYSGMNDCMWDLASLSLECDFTENDELRLLNIYFNGNVYEDNKTKLQMYKILQDFIWSLWANIKVKEGEDFLAYAVQRYKRCKDEIKVFKNRVV
ncbi:NTP transferase domain-containing protein [Clostridium sporogenes]|uniref:NTP transferase domain-containing protein n=1 Tax=Clostridium sporogenes TaxID=1509 RepID=A0AAE4JS73_CLOSG|nr:NTP transferase domain-containing protein [Clostridium sporogenes]MDS1002886.1 NTP transferase domain-containing protein [Clostridium sporogenes]